MKTLRGKVIGSTEKMRGKKGGKDQRTEADFITLLYFGCSVEISKECRDLGVYIIYIIYIYFINVCVNPSVR